MSVVSSLHERYAEVRGRVEDAARRSGRRPDQVILVAVTKYAELDQIKSLVELGHRDLGENQVQQLTQRAAMIQEYLDRLRVLKGTIERHAGEEGTGGLIGEVHAPDEVRWHMIGHMQRNKVRRALEVCRLVHSVDSLKIAEEIQATGLARDRVYEVLIQVDCSGESTKFGCPAPAAIPLAEQIGTMANVRLRGLMTMAPHAEDPEEVRPVFARCRELLAEMHRLGVCDERCNILSMGMTTDFEVAIEEGANIVRVGSAIFGNDS